MIALLDFSQVVISAAIEYHSQTKEAIKLPLLRHITVNNLLFYKKKFKLTTENLILCADGRDYWRKGVFPLYKQNRKKDHDKSAFNWDKFFEDFNQIKTEIKTELPFNVVEVYGCEADDVIAVLSKQQCPHQDRIIIISSDKDLIQIQENICPKVEQWSPFHKKFISPKTNSYSLFEHVIRGDAGDGIPNILSDDDVFMDDSKRSKPIRATSIMQWEQRGGMSYPESFCTPGEMLERFNRNLNLIDLRQIPECFIQKIIEEFSNYQRPPANVFGYLTKHKLKKILESGVL